MEDNNLDFLDQLLPGGSESERDAAPRMQKPGNGRPSKGRSLPPPPPSLLKRGAAQPPHEIDIDFESAVDHPVPEAAPLVESDPASASRIPMPAGVSRSQPPPPLAAARPGPPPPPSLAPPPAAPVVSRPPPPPSRRPAAEAVAAPPMASSAPPPPPPRPPAEDELATSPLAVEAPPEIEALAASSAYEEGHPVDDFADAVDADGVAVAPQVWGHASVPPSPPIAAPTGADAFMAHARPQVSAPPAPPTYAAGSSAPPPPPPAMAAPGISLPPPPSLPPAPAASYLPPPAAAPVVDHTAAAPAQPSDWDDDPTTVYSRESFRPSETTRRAAPPPVSLPPMPTVPSARAPGASVVAGAWLKDNGKLVAAAAVALVGVLIFMLVPRGPATGQLLVNITGPGGTPVDGVKVYLDERLVCEKSPCQLQDVEARGHLLMAEAEGFNKTAAMAVLVPEDDTKVHDVTLVPSKTNTGINVPESPGEVTLFVDGNKIGTLPQEVDDLQPGKHTLRFTAGERYEPLEREVTLAKGEVLPLEPIALKVKLGKLTLTEGENAEGADVLLRGKRISLPHTTDIDTSQKHTIIAGKEGFQKFKQVVEFEDGDAELEVAIDLVADEEADAEEDDAEETKVAAASSPSRSRASQSSARRTRSKAKASSSSGGMGKLTLLSVPPTVVLVDGRPMGKTPKRGLAVSAGSHSIVFVHPEKGRKRRSANVASGASKTVAVRF